MYFLWHRKKYQVYHYLCWMDMIRIRSLPHIAWSGNVLFGPRLRIKKSTRKKSTRRTSADQKILFEGRPPYNAHVWQEHAPASPGLLSLLPAMNNVFTLTNLSSLCSPGVQPIVNDKMLSPYKYGHYRCTSLNVTSAPHLSHSERSKVSAYAVNADF